MWVGPGGAGENRIANPVRGHLSTVFRGRRNGLIRCRQRLRGHQEPGWALGMEVAAQSSPRNVRHGFAEFAVSPND